MNTEKTILELTEIIGDIIKVLNLRIPHFSEDYALEAPIKKLRSIRKEMQEVLNTRK